MAANNYNRDGKFHFKVQAFDDLWQNRDDAIEGIGGWPVWYASLNADEAETAHMTGVYLVIDFKNSKVVTVTIPKNELIRMLSAVEKLERKSGAL